MRCRLSTPTRQSPLAGGRARTTKGTIIAKRADRKDIQPQRPAARVPLEQAAEALQPPGVATVVVRRFRRGRWTVTALPV